MKKNLDTIMLFIDEDNVENGVDAISFVKYPAIEENFIALSEHKVEFKTVDSEKRVIIGLALVPDKLILRRDGDKEFNIMFNKETVAKAAQLYLKRLHNNNTTLEHEENTEGVSVVESWIVEDPKKDKTAIYNLNAVEGAWAVVMKVDNEQVWKDVKDGKYLGLSIEGIFTDKKVENQKEKEQNDLIEAIKNIIKNVE